MKSFKTVFCFLLFAILLFDCAVCFAEFHIEKSPTRVRGRIVESSAYRLSVDVVFHARKLDYRIVSVRLVSPSGGRYQASETLDISSDSGALEYFGEVSGKQIESFRYVFEREGEAGAWKLLIKAKGPKGRVISLYKVIETSNQKKDVFVRFGGSIRGDKIVNEERLSTLQAIQDYR